MSGARPYPCACINGFVVVEASGRPAKMVVVERVIANHSGGGE